MGFLVFLALIIAFYFYVARNWKEETKRNVKIAVCVISLFCTVFLLMICGAAAKDLYENEKDRSLSGRMDAVAYELKRGDYLGTVQSMQVSHDYEDAFEYVWERCEMYMTRNFCTLYREAAKNNPAYEKQAAEWEKKLSDICTNPDYGTENARYGEYFQNSVR